MTTTEGRDETTNRTTIDPPTPFEVAYDPDPNNFGIERDTSARTQSGDGTRERSFRSLQTGTKHMVALTTVAAAREPVTTAMFIDGMDARGFVTDGGELTQLWVRGAIERSAAREYGDRETSHLWWVNSHGVNILAEAVDVMAVEAATDDTDAYGHAAVADGTTDDTDAYGHAAVADGTTDDRGRVGVAAGDVMPDGGRPLNAVRNALGFMVTRPGGDA